MPNRCDSGLLAGTSGMCCGSKNPVNPSCLAANTAPYRILQALPLTSDAPDDTMTEDVVVELIAGRPYKKIQDVQDKITNQLLREKCLSVKSHIFKITSIGVYNDTGVKIEGIFYRDGKRFFYWSVQ